MHVLVVEDDLKMAGLLRRGLEHEGYAVLVGLELLEPLAQEIDRCTILELVPVPRGAILARHLVVPAVGMRLVYRTALPPAVAAAGFLPVVLAQKALEPGADPVSSARSAAVVVALVASGVATWVRHGDDLGERWAAAAAQTTTPSTRSVEP